MPRDGKISRHNGMAQGNTITCVNCGAKKVSRRDTCPQAPCQSCAVGCSVHGRNCRANRPGYVHPQCFNCLTTGVVDGIDSCACLNDFGEGYPDPFCPSCNGSGVVLSSVTMQCEPCNGQGIQFERTGKCSDCKGKGLYPHADHYYYDEAEASSSAVQPTPATKTGQSWSARPGYPDHDAGDGDEGQKYHPSMGSSYASSSTAQQDQDRDPEGRVAGSQYRSWYQR